MISLMALSGCTSTGEFNVPRLKLPDWSLFGGKNTSHDTNALGTASAIDDSRCPPVSIVPDLNRMVQFEGQKWVGEVQMTGLTRQCQLMGNIMRVTITIDSQGRLGPEGQKQAKVQANYSYPYLIAVIDPSGQIASKDVFALNAVYQKAQSDNSWRPFRETITQSVPAPNGVVAPGTYIQIGFLLSPAELAYNRQNQ